MSQEGKQTSRLYSYWLARKKNEFADLGYHSVTLEDIWSYFKNYLWKKEKPRNFIQRVRDIVNLTPNDYFNYATLKAQVYDVKSLNEYDMSEVSELF